MTPAWSGDVSGGVEEDGWKLQAFSRGGRVAEQDPGLVETGLVA